MLDYVGGQADLEGGLLRAIGDPDVRFREDHLRLLRAIRFAARLGFHIEPATFAAIRRHHRSILGVSAERVRDELTRILTEGGARRGFELLDATGLLAVLLPEVAAMKGVEQPPEYHPEGDVWVHTLLLLEKLRQPSATLASGALLHDAGKPPTFRVAERIRFDGHVEEGVALTRDILSRLRFSREDMEQVEALVANHMRFKDVQHMRESTLKRFLRLPRFDEHLELHRLDALSSNGCLENYDLVKLRREELSEERLRPPRLISGDDLMADGYHPGPLFSEILAAVEDAQLEGRHRHSGRSPGAGPGAVSGWVAVGQVVNLRPIGNRPGGWSPARGERVYNPLQVNNLPHHEMRLPHAGQTPAGNAIVVQEYSVRAL